MKIEDMSGGFKEVFNNGKLKVHKQIHGDDILELVVSDSLTGEVLLIQTVEAGYGAGYAFIGSVRVDG